MSTSSTHALYGLASTVTDPATGLSGLKGVSGTRKSMPLAVVDYAISVAIDAAGGEAVVDLADGTATGAVAAVAASGSISLGSGPDEGQSFEVNGTTYVFKNAATGETDVTIGADTTETSMNAAAVVNAYDPTVVASGSGSISIVAAETGEAGNAITLSASGDDVSASAATLEGGVNGVAVIGAGVDSLGMTLPAMAKVHGLLVVVTAGKLLVSVAGVLREIVEPNGGLQSWSAPGRADLVADMRLVAATAGTMATVTLRASE
jgi:hypothetical protein